MFITSTPTRGEPQAKLWSWGTLTFLPQFCNLHSPPPPPWPTSSRIQFSGQTCTLQGLLSHTLGEYQLETIIHIHAHLSKFNKAYFSSGFEHTTKSQVNTWGNSWLTTRSWHAWKSLTRDTLGAERSLDTPVALGDGGFPPISQGHLKNTRIERKHRQGLLTYVFV